mmetsp:Transcript_20052/g.36228  ORF Transcript_20052/g.36228 Transcript_20052/m.36228 type:complete len:750 (-) Transcript_20052:198-2447(-)
MEISWDGLVRDLQNFPGEKLALSKYECALEHPRIHRIQVSLDPGEVFESAPLELQLLMSEEVSGVQFSILQDDEPMNDGIAAAMEEARSVACGEPSVGLMRSVLLRFAHALNIDFSQRELQALRSLGKGEHAPAREEPQLLRLHSESTSVAMSDFSFESMTYEQAGDDTDMAFPSASSCTFRGYAASLQAPEVADVIHWKALVDGLKRFPGSALEFQNSSSWDGVEGQVQLTCKANADCMEWESLEVVVAVRPEHAHVDMRGAQVIPVGVGAAVEELNSLLGTEAGGPAALHRALCGLCEVLQLPLSDHEQTYLRTMGDRGTTAVLATSNSSGEALGSEIQREMKAVEALQMQLEVIAAHVQHLTQSIAAGSIHTAELQRELLGLQRTQAVVEAERDAARKSVEAALMSFSDTKAQGKNVEKPQADVKDMPAQSLRGHGADGAVLQIQRALASVGPWGHYAAYQFSLMLSREQELNSDFVCFYHSYSFASLMYEVQSIVAQHIYDLPRDFAPLPRLMLAGVAKEACMNIKDLQAKGGQDHDVKFRALGLSVSCSLFASGSEAPPLNCFQAGYSCNDLSFRGLLVTFLKTCLDIRQDAKIEDLVDKVVAVGRKHRLPVGCFERSGAGGGQQGDLAGYMLQIFVHRSIAANFAYPSQPYGVPVKGVGDIVNYTMTHGKAADGQARVLFHPPTMLNPTTARLFHYCARPLQSCMSPEVPSSRGVLLRELRELLQPVLSHSRSTLMERLGLSE